MIKISKINRKRQDIEDYLVKNDLLFTPRLSIRLNIEDFSLKLSKLSEQWWIINEAQNHGFMACYFNDPSKNIGYITTISIEDSFQGKGLGEKLLQCAIEYGIKKKFKVIRLEVNIQNKKAISLYEKNGFNRIKQDGNNFLMEISIFQ